MAHTLRTIICFEYVIFTTFALQPWLRERALTLRYTYIVQTAD